MKRDLPRRMYRHGLGYRYMTLDRKAINLGRDLSSALAKYHELTNPPAPILESDPNIALVMWRRHKKGAKQRNIEFTLTEDELKLVLAQQKYRCAVTGLMFRNDKPEHLRVRPWAPSIDRKDNRLGYSADNIRIVCGFVNVAMNGFGESFFLSVLQPLIEAEVQARLALHFGGCITMGTSEVPTEPLS